MKKIISLIVILAFLSMNVQAATQTPAKDITVNTALFTKNLNSSDSNVQAALETLDQIGSGGGSSAGSVNQVQIAGNSGTFAAGNMYSVGGLVGVNLPNPSFQLDVNGQINSSGGYVGIQVANVPILNQNTTGTAAGISGSQTANTVYAAPNGTAGTASFRLLSGNDLPNPTTSTKGGVQAIAQVSHQWINSISNTGVPVLSQPSYSDLTGSPEAITALTGDITATGPGSVPATLATVNSNVGTFQGITVNAKGLVTAAANQGYITGNQPITVSHSGDMSGTATGTTSISIPMTLNTVNSNTGSFGSSSAIPTFTVNGKGLMTAAGTTPVVAPASTLTGNTLASGVVNSSLTSVGTLGTGIWQATPISYLYGGLGTTTAPSNNIPIGNGTGWTLTGIPSCSGGTNALTFNTGTGQFGCNSVAAGGVTSVTNSDGSLIFNPTVGAVVGSINPNNTNTWAVPQYFNTNVGIGTTVPATLFAIGTSASGGSLTHNAFNINSSGNITNIGGLQANINANGANFVNASGPVLFGNYDTIGTGDSIKFYNTVSSGHIDFAPAGSGSPGPVLDTFSNLGYLGIGTTSPAYQIDEGNGTLQSGNVHYQTGVLGLKTQYGIHLDPTGGGPLMDLDYNRNVGINNNSPQYQLDVTGNIHSTGLTISGNGASTGYIWTATDSAGDGNWQANAGGAPTWSTSGSNIYNANAGNVGIGTINPTSALQVNGTITGSTFIGVNPAAMGDWPSTIAAPYTCTTNYYVNPSVSGASDSNNGTSLTTPFLTINGAITAVQAISNLQGNTCINVSPGAYSEATGGYTSIGGTRNWTFTVSSANATVGATYTNNNITFTVAATIASQTTLTATTPSAYFPYTSGTLTKASGTGDSTITYSAATAGTINYFTIRSTLNRQAIITIPTADAGSYVDCFRFDNSNFWVVDGFVCNGADSVAASNDSGVSNNGSNSFDSHVQIINGTWDHLGAAGIGINHFDYLTIAGNLVYHNADQNYTYNIQGSGISMYQDVASDGLTTPHNYIYGNVSRGNFIGPGNTNAHSDGNGIIIDDLAFDQNSCTSQPKLDITASGGFISSAVPHSGNAGSGCQVGNVLIVNQSGAIAEFIVATLSGSAVATVGNPITLNQGSGFTTASAVTTTMAYVYQTNIYNNVTHDNGGGGIHVFDGGYTLSYNNTDYNEYTDLLNTSTTGRAGINCSDTTNCQFINNIAVTNPYVPGSLGYNGGNTACGDYNYSGSNSGDVWENNDCYAGLGGYSYIFTISSASATSGATYTNNSCTFTVVSTISSGTLLQTTGTCNPTASGTLTKASGTGASTITFSAASNTFSVYTLGASSTTWSNNIGADPRFVNKVAFNYRLNAGSPAIGTALNESLTTDIDGKYIQPGAGYDMGAYQTNTISGPISFSQNVGIGTIAPTQGFQIGTDAATIAVGTILCAGTGNCVGQCTGTITGDSCTTCTCLPK